MEKVFVAGRRLKIGDDLRFLGTLCRRWLFHRTAEEGASTQGMSS